MEKKAARKSLSGQRSTEQTSPEERCYVHRHGLEAMFGKVKGDIDRDGYSIVGVMDNPPYSYTVGLTQSRKHQEILIAGIGGLTAYHLLIALIKRIPDNGQLPLDEPISEIANMPLVLKKMAPENARIANMARALYDDSFEMLQLVWPDENGRFPWQKGYLRRHNKDQAHYWRSIGSVPSEAK